MKKYFLILVVLAVSGCSTRKKYDPSDYYNPAQQDQVLAGIITYIFDAPPYTAMKDRFLPEHKSFYSSLTPRFKFLQYYVDDNGTHYFYIMRPGPKTGEGRGVGGHFRMHEDHQISGFREVFVTPVMTEEDVKDRCAFLFDEMVKGNIEKYLVMTTYVEWPNPGSYYDSLAYEWKQRPELRAGPGN